MAKLLIGENKKLAKRIKEVHEFVGTTRYFLLGLHIVDGALSPLHQGSPVLYTRLRIIYANFKQANHIMLDDLAKTVKAQLYERVSSPLFGAFAMSWVAWNYRFLLVLVSSMPVAEKFSYIDSHIFDSYPNIIFHGVLYPLITTLLLIFIYPYPAKFVYEYWRKRQRELKEVQQRIDDETPITREEARELRYQSLNARHEFEQELERRSGEVARLKAALKELQPREKMGVDRFFKESEKFVAPQKTETHNGLDEMQVHMLRKIAESEKGLAEKGLISSSGNDRVLTEYNLGELLARGYTSKDYSGERRDYVLTATHLGRSYLVNYARGGDRALTSS